MRRRAGGGAELVNPPTEPSNVCPSLGCGGYVAWELNVVEGKDKWYGSCYGKCGGYPYSEDGEVFA